MVGYTLLRFFIYLSLSSYQMDLLGSSPYSKICHFRFKCICYNSYNSFFWLFIKHINNNKVQCTFWKHVQHFHKSKFVSIIFSELSSDCTSCTSLQCFLFTFNLCLCPDLPLNETVMFALQRWKQYQTLSNKAIMNLSPNLKVIQEFLVNSWPWVHKVCNKINILSFSAGMTSLGGVVSGLSLLWQCSQWRSQLRSHPGHHGALIIHVHISHIHTTIQDTAKTQQHRTF